jgi:hypothetical protein
VRLNKLFFQLEGLIKKNACRARNDKHGENFSYFSQMDRLPMRMRPY